MILGNIIRETDSLRPRAAAEGMKEEMSSSSPPIVRRTRKDGYKK